MSVQKSAIAAAAALAASITVAGGVAEPLLNDISGVTAMKIVEVNERGNAVLFVVDATNTRVVCDTSGSVRVFGDASSAMGAVKRSKVGSAVAVTVRKFDPPVNVGSPIKSLIASHKQAVKELATATTQSTELGNLITAAVAQGWDVQVGTPQRAEHDNLVGRLAIVDAWEGATDTRITSLAAALTAAGINPATYQPIP